MFPLGITNVKSTTGCVLNFNTSPPFIDSLGRHSPSTSGVTMSSGRAVFTGASGSQIVVNDNRSDFSYARRPDISVTVNLSNYGSDRIIWATYPGSEQSGVEFYHKSDGKITLNLAGAGVIFTTYALPLGVDVVLRVVQVSNTWSIYADGVLVGTTTGSVTNADSTLVIGGYPIIGGRFVGQMDNFSWINT